MEAQPKVRNTGATPAASRQRAVWPARLRKWALLSVLIAAPVIYEMRTSAVQSWLISKYAAKLSYKVEPGPSPNIVFPKNGPFDVRAGYTLIPDFVRRLRSSGFEIVEQARFSPELERAAKWGLLPPFSEPVSTRLTLRGADRRPIFEAPVAGEYFNSFEEIPPVMVRSLLVIENREMEEAADDRTNPVVDWERLAKAALLYAGNKLGLPLPVEGASTLATQMEKYRHSYEGRTDGVWAKIRQMTDASLKVYQHGPDTREERRQIVLDYLNSIPMAAAPGYGELHGIGSGLNAWFGLSVEQAAEHLSLPDENPEKAKTFKSVLALLCAVKAPTYYLLKNRAALEDRVNFYVRTLAKLDVIRPEFAERVASLPIPFSATAPQRRPVGYAERKAVNDARLKLVRLLGVPGFYELDRLHLEVDSTVHSGLQQKVVRLFEKLRDPEFLDSHGLNADRLLAEGDPSKVVYGMMLFERTPQGNALRVITDNLHAPFDINTGMKMQLGSSAKLRVLASYLDIAALLYSQFKAMDEEALRHQAAAARDPLTRWAAETLNEDRTLDLDGFLQKALDRRYSASPAEGFFTGGGVHYFHNFDNRHNAEVMTVRDATIHSVNLVYIRLMRDLVRYYEARLPYDTEAVLADPDHPLRRKMLGEIAEEESRQILLKAYKEFQRRPSDEIVHALLGRRAQSERHLSILFYAWNPGAGERELTQWLEERLGAVTRERVSRMAKAYGHARLNLSDYAYLLGVHPLRLWCAGRLAGDPSLSWERMWDESGDARRTASAWLFKTRNRSAQELRLRTRFERDAFALMTPQWKNLGFPFDSLVPSLATAIGSSGDRPEALAHLMGILLDGGVERPTLRISGLRFAAGTPYETALKFSESKGRRVMPEAVSRAILPVLAKVVEQGTASRLAGSFKIGDRTLTVGGKTGSGDNRLHSRGSRAQVLSRLPIDRTAVFVFYIEDRYYGVVTAFVPGRESGEYVFTSSLPVAILKLLARDIADVYGRPSAPTTPDILIASTRFISSAEMR